MKFKYLLRGIGIGAILATSIMFFIYGKADNVLSDDEIRAKARELGMMTVSEFQDKELNSLKDKTSEKIEEKLEEKTKISDAKISSSDASSENKNTPSEESGKAKLSTEEGDKTGKASDAKGDETVASETRKTETKSAKTGNTQTEKSADNETKTADTKVGNAKAEKSESGNSENKKITSNPNGNVVVKTENTQMNNSKVSFSIVAGMSSEKVSASLKALGLIDDSVAFNKYLVNNGYASRIRIGTFELQKGQSYAEIATKLVK